MVVMKTNKNVWIVVNLLQMNNPIFSPILVVFTLLNVTPKKKTFCRSNMQSILFFSVPKPEIFKEKFNNINFYNFCLSVRSCMLAFVLSKLTNERKYLSVYMHLKISLLSE